MRTILILTTGICLSACGSPGRGESPDAGPCLPTSSVEICGNGVDDDCNFAVDCGDAVCSEHSTCLGEPDVCEAETPTAALSLPDGECGSGVPDISTCEPYVAELNLSGFPDGARLVDTSQLQGVCVTMEHTWIRDLEIRAECPDGKTVILSQFAGQEGSEVYLGQPNDSDGTNPVPGVGWEYCWKDDAANIAMLPYANANGTSLGSPPTLPAGDYQPHTPLATFLDCPLNGAWKFKVYDLWGSDNGYVFQVKFVFDNRVDCPIVE